MKELAKSRLKNRQAYCKKQGYDMTDFGMASSSSPAVGNKDGVNKSGDEDEEGEYMNEDDDGMMVKVVAMQAMKTTTIDGLLVQIYLNGRNVATSGATLLIPLFSRTEECIYFIMVYSTDASVRELKELIFSLAGSNLVNG
jgi:hypothetical protein